MNEQNKAEAILGAAEELAETLAPGPVFYGTKEERKRATSALTRALQSIGMADVWAVPSLVKTNAGCGPITPEIRSAAPHQQDQRAIAAALWQFVMGELRHWQEQDDGSIDSLTRRYRHLLESIAEWVAKEDEADMLVDMWAPQSVEVKDTEPECHHPAPMPEPMNLYCGEAYKRRTYVLAQDLMSACVALQGAMEAVEETETLTVSLLAKDVTIAK